jgi:hypothetical protein
MSTKRRNAILASFRRVDAFVYNVYNRLQILHSTKTHESITTQQFQPKQPAAPYAKEKKKIDLFYGPRCQELVESGTPGLLPDILGCP